MPFEDRVSAPRQIERHLCAGFVHRQQKPVTRDAPLVTQGLAQRFTEGERAILEGWVERDGKLPVNVSGGLKAKGHPVGATGVSMHVMTAMQLSGTAPEGLQLPKATIGGVFNMGGAAVANYVSILEPLR